MTILDILEKRYANNKSIQKALDIIKDNFISLVNDNYELIINEKGELIIKIPSLEKKNEYVYKNIGEYEYPLIMCMRISEIRNPEAYNYILSKFMGIYKDKLELFFKDVNTVNKLMNKIKDTKNFIDYVTYASIAAVIFGSICLCVFTDMSQTVKYVFISGIILSFILMLVQQFTKDGKVKKVIDGYISVIKTDWYRKELTKQYAFFCNFIG